MVNFIVDESSYTGIYSYKLFTFGAIAIRTVYMRCGLRNDIYRHKESKGDFKNKGARLGDLIGQKNGSHCGGEMGPGLRYPEPNFLAKLGIHM